MRPSATGAARLERVVLPHGRPQVSSGRATRVRQDAVEAVLSLTPVRFAPRHRVWPWALGAAAVGASAGAVGVLLARRVLGQDALDAQDPADLRAVVDTDKPAA